MNDTERVPKFWIIWCPQGNNPKYRHLSWTSAATECARLAAISPGKDFIIMAADTGLLSCETHTKVIYGNA